MSLPSAINRSVAISLRKICSGPLTRRQSGSGQFSYFNNRFRRRSSRSSAGSLVLLPGLVPSSRLLGSAPCTSTPGVIENWACADRFPAGPRSTTGLTPRARCQDICQAMVIAIAA